ncbi:MAG: hypothetical protein WC700_14480 [Gemmatimonadaceae bacterium]
MTQEVSFEVTPQEHVAIERIAERARDLAVRVGAIYPLVDALMDVTACHANGMPLDLDGLLAADDADFAHDVFGINRHIDRATGQLGDCFVPRYARR